MKIKDLCTIDCYGIGVVVVDDNYINKKATGSRSKHLICYDYEEIFEYPEVQNADIEYIDFYYNDCYNEDDEPSIALHINYKGD